MTVTVSVLGSGSRGNSTFIRTDEACILIDAGMSRREVAKRLEAIGENPDRIDAVLVTHEHTDHSAGLRVLVKELPVNPTLPPATIAGCRRRNMNSEARAFTQSLRAYRSLLEMRK